MRRRRAIWFVAGAIILAIVGVGGVLALRIFGGDAPAAALTSSSDGLSLSDNPDQGTAGASGSAKAAGPSIRLPAPSRTRRRRSPGTGSRRS